MMSGSFLSQSLEMFVGEMCETVSESYYEVYVNEFISLLL
jgi:hypothetical protein